MYIRARFTAVYAYIYVVVVVVVVSHIQRIGMCNYSGMYVELVYMYAHDNWARLPILLAVS